jgi:hypothetical protein
VGQNRVLHHLMLVLLRAASMRFEAHEPELWPLLWLQRMLPLSLRGRWPQELSEIGYQRDLDQDQSPVAIAACAFETMHKQLTLKNRDHPRS